MLDLESGSEEEELGLVRLAFEHFKRLFNGPSCAHYCSALLEDLFQGSFEVLGNLLEDLRERIADAEACVHRLYGARKFFTQARVIAVLLLGDPRIEEEQRTDERGKGEDERS